VENHLAVGLALCIPGLAKLSQMSNLCGDFWRGVGAAQRATAPSFSLYGGWQLKGSVNFNKYLGLTADFGGQYRSISGNRVCSMSIYSVHASRHAVTMALFSRTRWSAAIHSRHSQLDKWICVGPGWWLGLERGPAHRHPRNPGRLPADALV